MRQNEIKPWVLGTFLGVAVTVAGVSVADIFDQDHTPQTAMDQKIDAQTQDCAAGKEGTLGKAILDASKIHQEIASIAPPVEKLFRSDCLAGLNRLLDLSVTIPSLASIVNAAQGLLMQIAQRKVCQAVEKASDMIAGPINQGLGRISQYTNMSGLVNQKIGDQFQKIDPELGQAYISQAPTGQSYNVHIPDALQQYYKNTGADATGYGNANALSTPNQLNQQMQNIQQAQGQIFANQNKYIQMQPQLQQAQQQVNACQSNGSGGDCTAQQQNLQRLQQDQQNMLTQNQQLANNYFKTPAPGQDAANTSTTASNQNAAKGSIFDGLLGK